MQSTLLISLLLAFVFAKRDGERIPNPPTGSPDRIVTVPKGESYQVPKGASQPPAPVPSGRQNPSVNLPQRIEAGKPVDIQWSNGKGADYGYVNIDVVNSNGLMNQPLHVATVPAKQGHYEWQVPNYLKNGEGYEVRVWGYQQPQRGENTGVAPVYVQNTDPRNPQHFVVDVPGKVELGKPVQVRWDYSPVSSYPAEVDVRLCDADTKQCDTLATVPSSKKEWEWTPNDDKLCDGKHYIEVGSGEVKPDTPSDYGATSQPFVVNDAATHVVEDDLTPVEEEDVIVTETVTEDSSAIAGVAINGLLPLAAALILASML